MRRGPVTVVLDFEGDWEMMTTNPYGYMFCREFGRLFDVWSYIVRARQNGGEISHFCRAEMTSNDVPIAQK